MTDRNNRCETCSAWSELIARSIGGAPVEAMCIKPGSPKRGAYTTGRMGCEAHTTDPSFADHPSARAPNARSMTVEPRVIDQDELNRLVSGKALIYCVNDTPARRRKMAAARKKGFDVVHIPPPPPFSDWEQYSRLFGRDGDAVRRHMSKVLREIGRPELITWDK
jgi:hypothetical protein